MRVKMPEEGKNKLTFQNHHKQLPAPYIIYANLEALTTKAEGPELDPTKSNTHRTQHHEACSCSYIVVWCDGQTEPPVENRGPNAAEHFLRITAVRRVQNPKAMRMTLEDWLALRTAETPPYVTNLSRETLCVTTATLRVNIEGQPITPTTSSYG